jgi:hypothetical protein
MDEKKHQQIPAPSQEAVVSPLAQDKTYGEKTYDLIFNNLINFWVNLIASAAFTYWVTHSQKPIKLPFIAKEFSPPSVVQQKIAKGIHNWPIMGVFGPKGEYDIANPPSNKRGKAANNAANVLTLVTAGHPILILSVWLGAKIKAPFVMALDRKHYGDEAMDDPSLKARHEALEVAERPTLLGAVVGRIGTIFATQFTVYTIGNPDNLLNWVGRKLHIPGVKSFPGMDHTAEVIGNKAGLAVEELFPNNTGRMDNFLRTDSHGAHKFDWSAKQIQENPALKSEPYQRSAQHMGKYLAQDVLYTAVTASTITPAIHFIKKFIPGMTYTPEAARRIPSPELQKLREETRVNPGRVAQLPDAANQNIDTANDQPAPTTETPQAHVSAITNQSTLIPRENSAAQAV